MYLCVRASVLMNIMDNKYLTSISCLCSCHSLFVMDWSVVFDRCHFKDFFSLLSLFSLVQGSDKIQLALLGSLCCLVFKVWTYLLLIALWLTLIIPVMLVLKKDFLLTSNFRPHYWEYAQYTTESPLFF